MGCLICKKGDANVFPVDEEGKYAVCAECYGREVVAKRQCFICKAKLGVNLIGFTENSTRVIEAKGIVMIVEDGQYVCEECEQSGAID